jgi:hypothetical protein
MVPMEDTATTDQMRHIPSLETVIRKVDEEFRRQIDLYYQSAFGSAHDDRELEHEIESRLRTFTRSLIRLAAAAGRSITPQERDHLRVALETALNESVGALRSIDVNLYGRRQPFNRFERSRWERIFSGYLEANCRLAELLPLIEKLDADVRMKLMDQRSPREMPLLEEAVSLQAWQ